MREFTVNANDAGQRLDKFLNKLLYQMPPSMLYKMLRKKRVKVNGRKGTADLRLNEGDRLQLYISDEFFEDDFRPTPAAGKLPKPDIIYEDENILIADKPSGLVAHASAADSDSMLGRIIFYLIQSGAYCPEEEHTFAPALCHRIDRNTSGLVIAAKNAAALRMMNEKIRKKEVKKFYLCRTEGVPPKAEGTLSGYLIKEKQRNFVRVIDDLSQAEREASEAKPAYAQTHYRVLRREGNTALVEAELLTGRTHQIRAQFAHIGCPLVGDVKYGASRNGRKDYQQLRAYKLLFDFQTDAGVLRNLNGKEIVVGK